MLNQDSTREPKTDDVKSRLFQFLNRRKREVIGFLLLIFIVTIYFIITVSGKPLTENNIQIQPTAHPTESIEFEEVTIPEVKRINPARIGLYENVLFSYPEDWYISDDKSVLKSIDYTEFAVDDEFVVVTQGVKINIKVTPTLSVNDRERKKSTRDILESPPGKIVSPVYISQIESDKGTVYLLHFEYMTALNEKAYSISMSYPSGNVTTFSYIAPNSQNDPQGATYVAYFQTLWNIVHSVIEKDFDYSYLFDREPKPKTNIDMSQWVSFTDDEIGIRFKYPPEWGTAVSQLDDAVEGKEYSIKFPNSDMTAWGASIDYDCGGCGGFDFPIGFGEDNWNTFVGACASKSEHKQCSIDGNKIQILQEPYCGYGAEPYLKILYVRTLNKPVDVVKFRSTFLSDQFSLLHYYCDPQDVSITIIYEDIQNGFYKAVTERRLDEESLKSIDIIDAFYSTVEVY